MPYLKKENRAIFLDRDGVIFKEVDHLWKIRDAKFYISVKKSLINIQKKYKIIIVTNQGGIGKNLYRKKDYLVLNKWMLKQFQRMGIHISAVYYCPHHPDKKCSCRKPNSALFFKAKKRFNLNLKKSWMIGDKTSDILAGKKIGCKNILVKTGYAGRDGQYHVKPDFKEKNLFLAIRRIAVTDQEKI